MWNRIKFFSEYIFEDNKINLFISTVMDLATFAVRTFPIMLIAGSGKEKENEINFLILGASLVMAEVIPQLRNLLLDSVTVKTQEKLSCGMHKAVFAKPLDKQLGTRIGELSRMLASNYTTIEKIVPGVFGGVIPTCISTLGLTATLASKYSHHWFAAIPPGMLIINLAISAISIRKSISVRKNLTDVGYGVYGTILESASCYTIAHQFGNIPYELSRVKTIVKETGKLRLNYRRIETVTGLFQTFLNYASFIGSLTYAGHSYATNTIDQYDFAMITYWFFSYCKNLGLLGPALNDLSAAYEDGKNIVKFNSEIIPSTPNEVNELNLFSAPSIRFDNVSAGYRTKDEKGNENQLSVLQNISFEVKSGETIAIVGKSGTGKSTIINLLLKFYRPISGHIYINDIDIATIESRSLREYITVIPQDANLFNGTISDNIKYGCLDMNNNELKAVAKIAHLFDTVEDKKLISENKEEKKEVVINKVLSTQVGEKGMKISGGERQRVAIARSYAKGGLIFLADEPTSSLDPHTEEQILADMYAASKGATTVLVTHKLYTLSKVDSIYVIEEGKVVEHGTFDELVAKKQIFYNQLEAQCRELGVKLEDIRAKSVSTSTITSEKSKDKDLAGFSITRTWIKKHIQSPENSIIYSSDAQPQRIPLLKSEASIKKNSLF